MTLSYAVSTYVHDYVGLYSVQDWKKNYRYFSKKIQSFFLNGLLNPNGLNIAVGMLKIKIKQSKKFKKKQSVCFIHKIEIFRTK